MKRTRRTAATRRRPSPDIADAALRAIGFHGAQSAARETGAARRVIADCYRLVGTWLTDPVNRESTEPAAVKTNPGCPPLSPRLRQTLLGLLSGESEKQIARRLQISPHTVHVYVKTLHRRFDVNSRGELLARFVTPANLPE